MSRFPDGARVCFIGDSIVAENLALARIVDFYEKSFKDSGIRFFNCGIAGGTAESALRYLEKDIMRHAPTHAVIATGVNDSDRWYLEGERSDERTSLMKAAFEKYKRNLPALVDTLRARGVEVTICTPLPYDEYTVTGEPALKGGYALMLGYADFVREYAAREGLPLVDYHAYFADAIQTDLCYSPDHIHPNPHGYYRLAACFLAHQGLDIGAEAPLPDRLVRWCEKVAELRIIFAAEYMLIKDLTLNDEQKLAFMHDKIEREDWGQAVFERFFRAYVKNKPREAELYREVEEFFESYDWLRQVKLHFRDSENFTALSLTTHPPQAVPLPSQGKA